MNKKNFIIAIDGTVGSGKGTLAFAVAKRLNVLYLYTGGMYRALALACLRKKINLQNEEKVLEVLNNSEIRSEVLTNGTKVFLGSEDINNEIFLPSVTNAVPITSAHPKVREEMVKRQKEIIDGKSAVVEGRDVATKIAPGADIKIYLTADINTRAKRRYEQLLKRNVNKTLEDILRDTKERDRLDTEREASPLTIVSDAYVIDTTDLTIEETVEKVMEKIKEKNIL